MARPKKQESEQDTGAVLSPQDILKSWMKEKENADKHLNFVDEVYYKVSTGSLIWDVETGGGITPGLHRLVGPPESGKSSVALEFCRNFLEFHAAKGTSARGLYVKAEGRLSIEMQQRCGLKFVFDIDEWVDGTIFVLESNIYEFIINSISKLVTNPDNKTLFCFIIDSIDGLILYDDSLKNIDGNNKVAGAPALSKKFLQKMGNGMSKRGHMCLMLSQYSTNISIDPYAPPDSKRPKQGGGGHALAHYANFAFELPETWNGDLLRPDMKKPPGPTNRPYGKRVSVKFKKTANEKTGIEISYPIKFGVIGGSSIWGALEVVDYMKMYSMIKIAQWITFHRW